MKTNLVLKLSLVLAILLGVVLYKMNDFYRQEKLFQAEAQVKKQIVAIKTSVASQLSTIKNVVSSYNVEIKEGQINWVQLDPFFALARVQKTEDGGFKVSQVVGRSGTGAEKWTASYLEKALSVNRTPSDEPIQARLFKDRNGAKYLALIFNNNEQQQTAVVGSADYFQKFFDLDRDGRMVSFLATTDHILVAHTESDYIANLTDEENLSPKKYVIEKAEIAGTNLTAMSYSLRKAAAAAWVVPWSVVGMVAGFGCILIGLLFYGLDPIEKKVERYRKQEREQIFKDTLQAETEAVKENLVAQGVAPSVVQGLSDGLPVGPMKPAPKKSAGEDLALIQKTREDSVDRAQQAFAEPTETLSENAIVAPLKQALANMDSLFKQHEITVEKNISSTLSYGMYYGSMIRTFENILRNAVDALDDRLDKKIVVRAYDIDQDQTVIEIQDNGVGLPSNIENVEKVWQPFFTTKSKASHMGLGLTESLSNVRRAGGDLTIESLPTAGVLVKMIMKKQHAIKAEDISSQNEATRVTFAEPDMSFNDDFGFGEATRITTSSSDSMDEATAVTSIPKSAEDELLDLDLDKVLALDEAEAEILFTPQKINLEAGLASQIKSAKMPEFQFRKKTYAVDQFQTRVRRPEKTTDKL